MRTSVRTTTTRTPLGLSVRDAYDSDLDAVADHVHREWRERHQRAPGLARVATDSREFHRARLAHALATGGAVCLVAERGAELSGYLFGSLARTVPDHLPARGTAVVARVRDFSVFRPDDWWGAGAALLAQARRRLRLMGASAVVVDSAGEDAGKKALLWRSGLTLTGETYLADLGRS
ncbi:GNAT family N-acetyltransferase [Marinitenerispora sediminis]|uniref:N-acetyltransferase n=1 Tax=Marinitenerispora sediminis TaxID=1931232 RepID=A0A368T9V1_9ACTN|nr:GNAT family N-acetyltransferase [Marinitenerispora sediminis]RCV56837.1 N-acetyltransferase [Marinitenerispora sediminis]RCV59012.1 N-acetyltransferase [Marinitenerispora sediminis]RCV61546.1 N-acetyltransferase [Marinitenerispora sediminis]